MTRVTVGIDDLSNVLREPLKWLADLKVGDKAMAIGYRSRYIVYTVERLTKTRIVMGCGARFSRDSGKFQGSAGYHVNYLMKFDHDLIAARELENTASANATG